MAENIPERFGDPEKGSLYGNHRTSVNRVRDLRIARGLTAAELAERSGLGYRTVRRVERNLVRRPHPRTLQRLAQALEVEPSELTRRMSEEVSEEDSKRRGSLLRELRIASGLGQPELARRAGLSQSFLSQLENGKYQGGPSTVSKLAEALGVDPSKLLEG